MHCSCWHPCVRKLVKAWGAGGRKLGRGSRWGQGQEEELGRVSAFPAPWRHSLSTLVSGSAGIRVCRETALPLRGHPRTRPVPLDSVQKLPATLGTPTLAEGWRLLSLDLVTQMQNGKKTRRGDYRKMSSVSQTHRLLSLHNILPDPLISPDSPPFT